MSEQIGTPDAPAAASSPATPVDASAVLASMTPDQRSQWELTGQLPDVSAESSPAPAAVQPASTDAHESSAASEPARPPKKGVTARNQQLDAEITALQEKLRIRAQLREELAALRPSEAARHADSAPAKPKGTEFAKYANHPDAPQEADFADYREFVAAMGAFVAEQRFAEREIAVREQMQIQRQMEGLQQTATEAVQHLEAFKAQVPDFDQRVNPALLEIQAVSQLDPRAPIQPHNVLAEELIKSPQIGPLMLHFSTPEGIEEWSRLCAMRPGAMLRAFGKLEARYEAGSRAASSRSVPSAPDPPTTLGRKPAAPVDDVAAALQRGDFRAYERAQNARDLARR